MPMRHFGGRSQVRVQLRPFAGLALGQFLGNSFDRTGFGSVVRRPCSPNDKCCGDGYQDGGRSGYGKDPRCAGGM